MNELLYQDQVNNRVKLSNFKNFIGLSQFREFSIKLVFQGCETYQVGKEKIDLKQGYYLLSSSQEQAKVSINRPALGLCLDLSFELIQQVQACENWLSYLRGFSHQVWALNQGDLGRFLGSLAKENLVKKHFDAGFFQEMSGLLFQAFEARFQAFSALNFKRQATQAKSAEQLAWIKNYLDENFLNNPKLDDLARLACMSKFNLIRLFKMSFGLSPHQYLLQKRLIYAQAALSSGQSIQELAWLLGFADGSSFSKAFKQNFGYPPSRQGK